MRHFARLFALLCLLSFTLLAQTNVPVVDIPGAVSVTITGINNGGDVTGYYCVQDGPCSNSPDSRGFVLESNGTLATFVGVPLAINDAGTVAGHIVSGPDMGLGFVRNKQGVITTFNVVDADDPIYRYTWAMAINNREEVAGYHVIYNGDVARLFVRDRKGTVTLIGGAPGNVGLPTGMIPAGINARGDLTGYSSPYFRTMDGYLVDRKGNVTMFAVPGYDTCCISTIRARPTAINNSGDIAGFYTDAESHLRRGFLRDSDGTFTKFDGIPVAMNERGDVVGFTLEGDHFVRDAASGRTTIFACPALPAWVNTGYGMDGAQTISMNNRGDVAGGNVICSTR